ncbi:MAG TPA: NAD(P)-binding protein, partial [Coriobacteriia bacterium]
MSPVDDTGAPIRHRASRAPRTPMAERDPAQRRMSFDEVGYGYTAGEAHGEAMRCLQCPNPTCIDGCPVHIDIKSFIGKMIEGDDRGAVEVLKSRNALPAVCGRVCPQEEQCEASCVLGRKNDPVAIGRLERFLGDLDLSCELDRRCRPELAPPSGKRVAIVGSGPSGLACAGQLAQLGHEVTIFESLHVA